MSLTVYNRDGNYYVGPNRGYSQGMSINVFNGDPHVDPNFGNVLGLWESHRVLKKVVRTLSSKDTKDTQELSLLKQQVKTLTKNDATKTYDLWSLRQEIRTNSVRKTDEISSIRQEIRIFAQNSTAKTSEICLLRQEIRALRGIPDNFDSKNG